MKRSGIIFSTLVVFSFSLSVMVHYSGKMHCADLSGLLLDYVEVLADCDLPKNAICTGDQTQYCTYKNKRTGTTIRCKGSTLIFNF